MKNAIHNQAAFILIFKRWIACVRVKRNKKRCKTSPPNRIIRHLFDQIIIGDGRPQGITKKILKETISWKRKRWRIQALTIAAFSPKTTRCSNEPSIWIASNELCARWTIPSIYVQHTITDENKRRDENENKSRKNTRERSTKNFNQQYFINVQLHRTTSFWISFNCIINVARKINNSHETGFKLRRTFRIITNLLSLYTQKGPHQLQVHKTISSIRNTLNITRDPNVQWWNCWPLQRQEPVR